MSVSCDNILCLQPISACQVTAMQDTVILYSEYIMFENANEKPDSLTIHAIAEGRINIRNVGTIMEYFYMILMIVQHTDYISARGTSFKFPKAANSC